MAAAMDPLPVPPRPWHSVGLEFLAHINVIAGFDNVLVVVDHLTRMAHFSLIQRRLLMMKSQLSFYKARPVCMACFG
jgi:hypothetical protein